MTSKVMQVGNDCFTHRCENRNTTNQWYRHGAQVRICCVLKGTKVRGWETFSLFVSLGRHRHRDGVPRRGRE